MNLFVLAAGLGTRFNPLTLKIPKPAIPFLNVPMGYYNFRFLKCIDKEIHTFVANTHHLPQQIENLYRNQHLISAKPQFSNEPGTILGTAGGIKHASPLFKKNEPILMMNADEIIFTENDNFLKDAFKQHNDNQALATLIVTKNPEVGTKFGAILCEGRNVKNIAKTITDKKLEPWHYIGLIILSWPVVDMISGQKEENIFYDILLNHLEKVQIYPIDADWYETGNQIDFIKASQATLTELKKSPVNAKYKNVMTFINQVHPSTLYKNENSVSLIADAKKLDSKNLQGFNVIAADSKIKSDHIENVIAFADERLI